MSADPTVINPAVPRRPSCLQILAGALVMLLCAALLDLWFCWPAGEEMDPYEYLVYLVLLGTFTLLWYPLLLLTFPRMQRYGAVAGFVTGILVDISVLLVAAVAYWGASAHPSSPTTSNAILGLELAYIFAYLAIFLLFSSWRILIIYTAGGWLAGYLMGVIRRARSQP